MEHNAEVRNRLPELLAEHGLSAYSIEQALRGEVARNSVYAMASGKTTRVDLGTLTGVLRVLREKTGKEFTVGDVLVYG